MRAFVLDAGRGPEPELLRRQRALRAVVDRASRGEAASLILDLDRTLVARDSRAITRAARDLGADAIAYGHLSPASEPLLAIPGVIAWCWARGGVWRRRIRPAVTEVTKV